MSDYLNKTSSRGKQLVLLSLWAMLFIGCLVIILALLFLAYDSLRPHSVFKHHARNHVPTDWITRIVMASAFTAFAAYLCLPLYISFNQLKQRVSSLRK